MLENVLNPELLMLRAAFQKRGHDLWFVGGCVRDMILHIPFKDIDFATDATPGEQVQIYREEGFSYIPTGIGHGTLTVVLNGVSYEITTLRTDMFCDGRHAETTWTRDLLEDLSRRDLTINAMALSFEGVLIDPHGGETDLHKMRVRFVGDPAERMKEDYLRILRLFRFHGRIAGYSQIDEKTYEAIKDAAPGLLKISRERVWSELSKILVGPAGSSLFMAMIDADIGQYIDLPSRPMGTWINVTVATNVAKDPVAALVAYLGFDVEAFRNLAEKWHMSAEERDRGIYFAEHSFGPPANAAWNTNHDDYLDAAKYLIAVKGDRKDWLVANFRVQNMPMTASKLEHWDVPEFPFQGRDLLAHGMSPGAEIGLKLRQLREQWGRNNYVIDKDVALQNV